MVEARRAARNNRAMVADGILEIAGIDEPSASARAAAAVAADFLVGASRFFYKD